MKFRFLLICLVLFFGSTVAAQPSDLLTPDQAVQRGVLTPELRAVLEAGQLSGPQLHGLTVSPRYTLIGALAAWRTTENLPIHQSDPVIGPVPGAAVYTQTASSLSRSDGLWKLLVDRAHGEFAANYANEDFIVWSRDLSEGTVEHHRWEGPDSHYMECDVSTYRVIVEWDAHLGVGYPIAIGNDRESAVAAANAYIYTARVRDFFARYLGEEYVPLPAVIMVNERVFSCNAYYITHLNVMAYAAANPPCANAAMPIVIIHECGHWGLCTFHADDRGVCWPSVFVCWQDPAADHSAYHEGMADLLPYVLTGWVELGVDFYGDGTGYVRRIGDGPPEHPYGDPSPYVRSRPLVHAWYDLSLAMQDRTEFERLFAWSFVHDHPELGEVMTGLNPSISIYAEALDLLYHEGRNVDLIHWAFSRHGF